MIEFNAVSKSFQGRPVLNDLSFHINRGEVIGLLGKSGTGKTTILQIVSGLIPQDSGTVKVNTSRIGYIFQEHRLIPWKTALENVCFPLKALGYPDKQAQEIGRDYLQKMRLQGFEGYYPGQLSGGMCQRVSIGRAFAVNPELLLLDEPFSALDPELKGTMMALMKEMLVQREVTLLYVSHNPEEVAALSHKVYMLSEGGTLGEIALDADKIGENWTSKYTEN